MRKTRVVRDEIIGYHRSDKAWDAVLSSGYRRELEDHLSQEPVLYIFRSFTLAATWKID